MPHTTALDPLFTVVDSTAFTDRHLANLAVGTLAVVRVPDFLDPDTCQTAMAALHRLPTAGYAPARVPTRIVRFGPALNDYRDQGGGQDVGRYWRDAEAARAAWQRAGMRPDPIAISLARLGSAWGAAVAPATIAGRPDFGGTLRGINAGALVHYDDLNREFPPDCSTRRRWLSSRSTSGCRCRPPAGRPPCGATAGSRPTSSTARRTASGERRSNTASAST
ncbi:hypothetical protein ACIG3E_24035 [Streptomyces sp. NPDC053474]|uniref:hypothetical protein n=1 Tax=Streptomyces sp. NPDC053474 TaxID=3365704 RepID=UPI0037D6B2D7